MDKQKALLTIERVLSILTPEERDAWASLPKNSRDLIAKLLVRTLKAQLDRAWEIAQKEERERIFKEIEHCFNLAKYDDSYFRLLVQDLLLYHQTGKTAAQRGHENWVAFNAKKALKGRNDEQTS